VQRACRCLHPRRASRGLSPPRSRGVRRRPRDIRKRGRPGLPRRRGRANPEPEAVLADARVHPQALRRRDAATPHTRVQRAFPCGTRRGSARARNCGGCRSHWWSTRRRTRPALFSGAQRGCARPGPRVVAHRVAGPPRRRRRPRALLRDPTRLRAPGPAGGCRSRCWTTAAPLAARALLRDPTWLRAPGAAGGCPSRCQTTEAAKAAHSPRVRPGCCPPRWCAVRLLQRRQGPDPLAHGAGRSKVRAPLGNLPCGTSPRLHSLGPAPSAAPAPRHVRAAPRSCRSPQRPGVTGDQRVDAARAPPARDPAGARGVGVRGGGAGP